ncbi:MAG: hypothetical protein LLG00_00120 [Planctomycetaceae bacterium]|nr:hypothetical protein [Planctomycetaceae bacterium]
MSQTMQTPTVGATATVPVFMDRRNPAAVERMPICERRQFGNSHEGLSPEATELAQAIDQYKLVHRRRFITFEEMLAVVKSLGYSR